MFWARQSNIYMNRPIRCKELRTPSSTEQVLNNFEEVILFPPLYPLPYADSICSPASNPLDSKLLPVTLLNHQGLAQCLAHSRSQIVFAEPEWTDGV